MSTQIWAHRGASAYAPENTLEAFQLALDMGADGIELDIQLSADGELMVRCTTTPSTALLPGQGGFRI